MLPLGPVCSILNDVRQCTCFHSQCRHAGFWVPCVDGHSQLLTPTMSTELGLCNSCIIPKFELHYHDTHSFSLSTGAGVETSKKTNAGSNKSAAHGPTKNLQKLENETEVFQHETVSSELKKQIQQARIAKKLTQAQLAQQINEKPQVINEYESGKAIPNPQVGIL